MGLSELFCQNNKLRLLPELPTSVIMLMCQDNELSELPALPVGLKTLDCSNNQLTELPDLPVGLTDLRCNGNKFPDRLSGESIAEFVERLERIKSHRRTIARCQQYKEALMESCWNTQRLLRIIEAHPTNQWNHEWMVYGDLEFTTVDEIL
jgi:hypothetical protein